MERPKRGARPPMWLLGLLLAASWPSDFIAGAENEQQPSGRPQASQQATVYTLLEQSPAASQSGAESTQRTAHNDDLNFNLMNAPQERIQAVKGLLDAQRYSTIGASSQQQQQPTLAASATEADSQQPAQALQCNHKGRRYSEGQSVPIEEQPCLNCTCARAILQCYLRVCPPIISLEAHERALARAIERHEHDQESAQAGDQRCRLTKEPNQCCPTLTCVNHHHSPLDASAAQLLASSSSSNESLAVSDTNLVSVNQLKPPPRAHNSDSPAAASATQAALQFSDTPPLTNRSAGDDLTPMESTSTATPSGGGGGGSIIAQRVGPKVTLIKGAIGERDSILLITSNQGSLEQTSPPPSEQLARRPPAPGNQSEPSPSAVALLDALLETVYSNALQQSSGLNIQGACMVNGSLYVEGSAVLPEGGGGGGGYCQYCYCIRQKVMCVRPKCQLSISGCEPKYANEYACCPTSFACAHDGHSTARLASQQQPQHHYQPAAANLSAKLYAAIESLSKLSAGQLAAEQAGADQSQMAAAAAAAAARTVDQSVAAPEQEARSSSFGSIEADNSLTERAANVTVVAQAPHASTPTSPSSSSISSSSHSDSSSSSTLPPPPPAWTESSQQRHVDETGDTDEGSPSRGSDSSEQVHLSEASKSPNNSTGSTTTEPPGSSVADFLEPMSRLGPLVPAPAPSGCVENGRQYAIGEQIPTLESCKHCYCGLDGLKECKIIECGLRASHSCRPIVPEGHCCPVRYECPSDTSAATSKLGEPVQRHRGGLVATQAPSDSEPQPRPPPPVSQCAGSLGETTDCATGGDQQMAPVLKTTRLVEDDAAGKQSAAANQSGAPPAANELGQFIMQINSQNSSSPAGQAAESERSRIEPQLAPSPVTQEMMISDQRSRMVDYHSVEANAAAAAVAAGGELPPGAVGIPSIEPEPIGGLLKSSRSIQSEAEEGFALSGHTNPTPTGEQPGPAGQRDSRSTNGHRLAAAPANPDPPVSTGEPAELPDFATSRFEPAGNGYEAPRPASFTNNHNSTATLSDPTLSRMRLLLRNRLAGGSSGGVGGATGNGNISRPVVLFDDEIAANHPAANENSGDARLNYTIAGDAGERPETTGGGSLLASSQPDGEAASTPSPPQPTTGTPIGLEHADRHSPESSGWLRSFTGMVSSFGRRLTSGVQPASELQVAGSSDDSGGQASARAEVGESAPTGRSRINNSHSSLIGHILNSMIGLNQHQHHHRDERQVANPGVSSAGAGGHFVMRPLSADMIQSSSTSELAASSIQQSKSVQSPYETLEGRDNSSQQADTRAASSGDQEASSGSRQVANELNTSDSHERTPSGWTPSSMSGSQQLDISLINSSLVSSSASSSSSSPASQFSRRSDVSLEPDESSTTGSQEENSSEANSREIHQLIASSPEPDAASQAAASSPQPLGRVGPRTTSLTCTDLRSGLVYQPNEIMPKNDPCLTCTCVLGAELCQTLVCPPKPADNCSEERRPAECCPNYLCGSNVTHLTGVISERPVESQPQSQPPPPPMTSGRLTMASRLSSGQPAVATQRAMHVDESPFSRARNALGERFQLQQQQQQQARPQQQAAAAANMLQSAQLGPQTMSDLQQRLNLMRAAGQQLAPAQQPQQPMRISDLPAHMIPAHLRYKLAQANFDNRVPDAALGQQQPPPPNKVRFPAPIAASRPPIWMQPSSSSRLDSQAPKAFAQAQNGLRFGPVGGGAGGSSQQRPASANSPLSQQVLAHPRAGLNPFLANSNNNNNYQLGPTRRFSAIDDQPQVRQQQQQQQPALPQAAGWQPSGGLVVPGSQAPRLTGADQFGGRGETTSRPASSSQSSSFVEPIDGGFRPVSLTTTASMPTTTTTTTEPTTAGTSRADSSASSSSSSSLPMVPLGSIGEQSATPTTVDTLPAATGREISGPPPAVGPASQQIADQTNWAPSSRFGGQQQPESFTTTTTTNQPIEASTHTSTSDAPAATVSSDEESPSSLQPQPPSDASNLEPQAQGSSATRASVDSEDDPAASSAPPSSTAASGMQTQPPPTTDFDPMAMFRVSECNIYGKIYKVGERIHELSDSCKFCTCTQIGVECVTKSC